MDDINNRRHDLIGLEEMWATKWCPHRQFTSFYAIAEVNALNAKAGGRSEPVEAELIFWRRLPKKMLTNKITDSGGMCHSSVRSSQRCRRSSTVEHKLVKKPKFTWNWKWDPMENEGGG